MLFRSISLLCQINLLMGMKKLVFLLLLITFNYSFSTVFINSQSKSLEKNVEYYLSIDAENQYGKAKIVPIYRVPEEFLIKKAIHIKTKQIVEYDKNYSRIYSSSISTILSKYNVAKIRAPFFDGTTASPLSTSSTGIEKILEIYFSDEIDPYEVCNELNQLPDVEYATPIYIRKTFDYIPNDPRINQQWQINNISLPRAWDITKGSKNVVIAIVDSGVDWNHPDLLANIWTNPKEVPGNNVDDDGNGKIDDVRGWDFVGNVTTQQLMSGIYREDNDPTNIQGFHGTHVAGLASAVTDNGVGIASPGFSCSILPIKCSPDVGGMGIFRGYEAIVYAANMGAKVINCSWGGPGYSPAEQDIINYALEKGSLVVVAAGNDGMYIDYGGQYPAGYDNVLCVGASNSANNVTSFSNWGIKVTVYAPGQNVYSTMPNSSYSNQNGTSMAAPIVAGVAGLIASIHKEWSPKQILHQIRSTSDNLVISQPNLKPYYYGKVNAYKAVYYNSPSAPSVPGIEIISYKFAQGNAITDYNPKVLQLKIKNFLGAAGNVTLKISPLQNIISLSQNEFALGTLGTLSEKDVNLTITLLENNPWYLGNVNLLCTFESGNYIDYQILSLPIQINSSNRLTKVFTLPDAYKPTWYGASSPQFDCLWVVGQGGMFGSNSGFVLLRSGTSSANYIANQPIFCIEGVSSTIAFAGSGSQNQTTAYIYKTGNAGQVWTSYNVSSITGFVNAIYFFDSKEGIFLGDPKNGNWGIGRTTDGGDSWLPVLGIPLPQTNETGFVNSTTRWKDYVWFGTSTGRVFISSNRGKSWSFSNIPNAAIVNYITFRDSLVGMAVYKETTDATAPFYLATTTDGGKTWRVRQYNFTQNGLVPVYLFTPENSKLMYILCNGGQILGTSDLGENWVTVLNEYTGQIETGANIVISKSIVRLWQVGLGVSYLDFNLVPLETKKEIQLISENTLNYDTVLVGSNKLKTISLKNTGNVPANINVRIDTISSIADEFKIFGSVPNSISPGEEIQIRVRFVPKAEGIRTAKLIIESDAEPFTIAVNLLGVGKQQISGVEYNANCLISLYPNPAEDKLFFFTEDFQLPMEVTIIDVLGKEVLSFSYPSVNCSSEIVIPIGSIPSGIYFIKISNLNKIYINQFFKN